MYRERDAHIYIYIYIHTRICIVLNYMMCLLSIHACLPPGMHTGV